VLAPGGGSPSPPGGGGNWTPPIVSRRSGVSSWDHALPRKIPRSGC
jgi:hypothetical protein